MFFIGIITNKKNISFIDEMLAKNVPDANVVFITEKNIENMRNIKFEAILLDMEISKRKNEIRGLLSSCKYLILNHDINFDEAIFDKLNLSLISYGFNSKATFTISSVDESNLIICLQRIIFNKDNIKIEPQEYKVTNTEKGDKYAIIGTKILEIIYM